MRKTLSKVYPRECGAASLFTIIAELVGGLSPRVRGSREQRQLRCGIRGSIPASAGQPIGGYLPTFMAPVYPRECGAAHNPNTSSADVIGLSPRVRGSRFQRKREAAIPGSIPASAGQPPEPSPEPSPEPVYPRECGAAPRPFDMTNHILSTRGII